MASRYDPSMLDVPKVGDIVEYEGKRMVIIKTEIFSMQDDYRAYLLDEDLFLKLIPFTMESKDLLSKCTKERYSLYSPVIIPFLKIDSLPLKVEEISYTKIQLKE